MTRIIALANQKGGVGKTSCALNLAYGWARLVGPDKVLLVDADPQANATSVALGIPFANGPRRAGVGVLYEVLLGKATADDVIQVAEVDGNRKYAATTLHVLPSHLQLANIEMQLVSEFQREFRLREALNSVESEYEVIIIDCPPSLGLLTMNALVAATEVIIPVDVGVFPLVGIRYLKSTINRIKKVNEVLEVTGVIPTMVERTVLSRDTITQLTQDFPDLMLPEIPRRVLVGEAHASGQDIFGFAPNSDCTAAFESLVREVISRG